MKKALVYVACWLAIILASAVLYVLVGPWLIAGLLVELMQEQGESVQVTETIVSREQL